MKKNSEENIRKLEVGRELAVSVPIAIGISNRVEIANGWVSDADGSGEIGWGRVNMTDGSGEIASGQVSMSDGSGKTVGGRVNQACGSPKTARGRVEATTGMYKYTAGRVMLPTGLYKYTTGRVVVPTGKGELPAGEGKSRSGQSHPGVADSDQRLYRCVSSRGIAMWILIRDNKDANRNSHHPACHLEGGTTERSVASEQNSNRFLRTIKNRSLSSQNRKNGSLFATRLAVRNRLAQVLTAQKSEGFAGSETLAGANNNRTSFSFLSFPLWGNRKGALIKNIYLN